MKPVHTRLWVAWRARCLGGLFRRKAEDTDALWKGGGLWSGNVVSLPSLAPTRLQRPVGALPLHPSDKTNVSVSVLRLYDGPHISYILSCRYKSAFSC